MTGEQARFAINGHTAYADYVLLKKHLLPLVACLLLKLVARYFNQGAHTFPSGKFR
jgi:hypothetical protein